MTQHAKEIIERHSKSFSLATKMLPASIAADVRILYAWCRACDNAVDDATSPLTAKAHLEILRADVHSIYADQPTRLAESVWLREIVVRYSMPEQWPLDLLTGMESDIDFLPIQTVSELERYCYRAAGVVGLMMTRILGSSNPRALLHAKSLGIAMQMTNIARDVAEDQRRGRCYLPAEWFDHPRKINELTEQEISPAVRVLLDLAERHYQHADDGLKYLPFSVRPAIRGAAMVYREVGEVIRRADYRVMQRRHFVSKGRKLWLIIKAWGREVRSHILNPISSTDSVGLTISKGEFEMKTDSLYLATFALSLSLIMATAMFALVGINPKLDSYRELPWIYSGCSALGALAFGWLSRHIKRVSEDELER